MNTARKRSILKSVLLPMAAIAALLLIIAWMAGSFRDRIEPGRDIPDAGAAEQAVAVSRESITVTEPVPASVGARQATTISSRILARITHTLKDEDTRSRILDSKDTKSAIAIFKEMEY